MMAAFLSRHSSLSLSPIKNARFLKATLERGATLCPACATTEGQVPSLSCFSFSRAYKCTCAYVCVGRTMRRACVSPLSLFVRALFTQGEQGERARHGGQTPPSLSTGVHCGTLYVRAPSQ